jgi:hypothetical protein
LGKSLQEPWAEISLAFASEAHSAGRIPFTALFVKPFNRTMSRRKKGSNVQSIATRTFRSSPGNLKR